MRVALVGAEFEENLAVRYLRGALEASGHEVVQIVFNSPEETERAAWELARSGAAATGFSMVFTYRAREFARLAARARQLGYRGFLVAGGHFAAFNAEALLRDAPAFDAVAVGEGEGLICELAEQLAAGRDAACSVVRGLVWRDASGAPRRNAPAVKPPDLDALPRPTRKSPPDAYLGLPIANLLGSRGCEHHCAFCSIAAWHLFCGGARLRLRAPESVAEEMARLYEQGYRIFNFHDDNFLLRDRGAARRRVESLDRELKSRRLGRIAFAIKARPDEVDEELFRRLKEMGLFRVFLGIEAGTAESLQRLGRGQTREHNLEALRIVNELDLHCCFNLLLLNPDSTLEDFRVNLEFLRENPRNPMNFCRTEIYSGTPLEARLRRQGRLEGTYWGYNYRIADERAQRLFEMIYLTFHGRNHGEPCVHHAHMGVDYEYQLRDHFFGPQPFLRQRVKDFIVRVNLDSCSCLAELCDAAERGFSSEALRAVFLADFAERIQESNRRLLEESSELLHRIRDLSCSLPAPAPARRYRSMAESAAALGLAATLAFSAGRAAAMDTHPKERVADPAERDPAPIRDQIRKELLPLAAKKHAKAETLTIVVVVGKDGVVTSAGFKTAGGAVVLEVGNLRFPNAAAGIYNVAFAKEEVAAALEGKTPAAPVGDQGDPKLLCNQQRQILGVAALRLPAQDLTIELRIDDQGGIAQVEFRKAGVPRTGKPLSDQDRKDAARWLKDLGHEDFAAREAAARSLQALGPEVKPLLVQAVGSEDPEIKARCQALLAALEGLLTGPEVEQAQTEVKGIADLPTEARGKRFALSTTKFEMERLKRQLEGTHICEMAPMPAPRD